MSATSEHMYKHTNDTPEARMSLVEKFMTDEKVKNNYDSAMEFIKERGLINDLSGTEIKGLLEGYLGEQQHHSLRSEIYSNVDIEDEEKRKAVVDFFLQNEGNLLCYVKFHKRAFDNSHLFSEYELSVISKKVELKLNVLSLLHEDDPFCARLIHKFEASEVEYLLENYHGVNKELIYLHANHEDKDVCSKLGDYFVNSEDNEGCIKAYAKLIDENPAMLDGFNEHWKENVYKKIAAASGKH